MRYLKNPFAIVIVVTVSAFAAPIASAAFVDPSVTPAGALTFMNWSRSDVDTTYQQWRGPTNGGTPSLSNGGENFTTVFGLNQPDNDYVNPNGVPTAQYLDDTRNSSGVTSAILLAGTQHLYSYFASADWEVLSPDYAYGSSHTTTVILQIEVLGNELLVGSSTPNSTSAPNTVKVDGQGWVDHVELSRVGAGGGGDEVTHWFRFELPVNVGGHVVELDTYDASLGAFSADLYGHVSVSAIALDTYAHASVLQGDLDGDGFVGIADLNIVLGAGNQSTPLGNPLADPTGDGFVGIADLNIVLGNWNAGTPPASVAVPEPAVLMLILGVGLPAIASRTLDRRRA
jgi:hypothetical protein